MDLEKEKLEISELLSIPAKKQEILKIQEEMSSPQFWTDNLKARQKISKMTGLQAVVNQWQNVSTEKELKKLRQQTLFSGQYDQNNALLSLHAGAGGTEAQDWAEMLLRMYRRFAGLKKFRDEVLDISPGEEAGIKSATLRIAGLNAYGWLKSEAGVHRLVRISPYDADKARHTSFALIEVIPEIETAEVEIKAEDLRIDVYRSRGHGGQGVNTTDSAVRITHLPSGIVVACQNERSQLQNKTTALKILQSRLFGLKLRQQQAKEKELKGGYQKAEWGSQIRSYVLHPYKLVKDHRTGMESKEPEKVLAGELDGFIEAYLENSKSKAPNNK